MIRFACPGPGCGAIYTVADEKGGKTGKCPKCQSQFVIPQPEAAAPPPAPPRVPPPPPPPTAPAAAASVEIAPCPGCQARLSVDRADLGADIECPYCKTVYTAARPAAVPPRPAADRPSRRPSPVEEDERPSRRGRPRVENEDEDDRPSRRGRARANDDDEDDDRPSRRRDDRDEDDDQPRRRRRSARSDGGPAFGLRIASAVLSIIVALSGLACSLAIMFGGATFVAIFTGAVQNANEQNPGAANGAQAALNGMLAVFIGCGLVILLFAALYLMAGIGALVRKTYGRVLTIICGILSALGALFYLAMTAYILFRFGLASPAGPILTVLFLGTHAGISLTSAFGRGADAQYR